MKDQPDEKNDKEVVGVPEHLKVWSANHFHWRCDDEDEGECDCHSGQPSNGGEHDDGWVLCKKTQACHWEVTT